jgi:hypothetical protein
MLWLKGSASQHARSRVLELMANPGELLPVNRVKG